ncbi:hypothetical protein KQI82_07455 [Oscillibacter sp. MSJ-2]|uniref:Fructose-bisphosphate aldolase n=1 Tax=Dysosmobacter acutus TaxID=2841504 RepID=A0ABS6F8X8_9FIRM|nr:hypothetical protein [Dysosmobacter acutus]MBU5626749.1 hypothetical protein [Dysosmobacter acutus]
MKSRYYKVFGSDDRTLILALDHGGAGKIWLDPGYAIAASVEGGVDAVLTNYGVIKKFRREIGRAGTILRGEVFGTAKSEGNLFLDYGCEIPYTVEDAVRVGADAVMTMGLTGTRFDAHNMQNIARVSAQCDRYGLLCGAEMLYKTAKSASEYDAETLNTICRAAAEIGADFVKGTFIDPDGFRKVVSNCYVPMVVLGGSKVDNDRQVLEQAAAALDCGAKGIAIGRNLWGHKNIAGMAAALRRIVHENATVDEALRELG